MRLRSITFDPSAEEAKEQEVQILTAEITRAFNLAGGKLKRMASFDAGSEATEMKVRTNMQRGLATRLHDLSIAFRKDQKQYIGTITKIRKGQSLQELFGSQREWRGGRLGGDGGGCRLAGCRQAALSTPGVHEVCAPRWCPPCLTTLAPDPRA